MLSDCAATGSLIVGARNELPARDPAHQDCRSSDPSVPANQPDASSRDKQRASYDRLAALELRIRCDGVEDATRM